MQNNMSKAELALPHAPGVRRRTVLAGIAGAALGGSLAYGALTSAKTPASAAGPTIISYVEVNNVNFAEAGKYVLADGTALIDVAIIFAANINYSGGAAQLWFNPQVQATLDNAATRIRPLQAKGIKVVLSILGNHQGAGIANFGTAAQASAFADQLVSAVNQYGLDGIDFDDEYADYGTNGTAQPNSSSFVNLVSSLRDKLGSGKIISFYDIGPAASATSYNGIDAGTKLNYAWNPYYGTWSVPDIAGMTKAQLSPAAVDIQGTSSSTAQSLAQRTLSDGYGVFMTYNLPGSNASSYLSGISSILLGQSTSYTG